MMTTMREARQTYFEQNGFGADGGYGDAWVDFKLGPIPFPFPNTPARIKAVKYHDLHHILTGYKTDFAGELEISAWEIGAGCKSFAAAWVLNLGGMGAGVVRAPGRVFRAFVRGRRQATLYGEDVETLLDTPVSEVKARFAKTEDTKATLADVMLYGIASVAGMALGLTLFAILVPLAPFGLVTNALRRRAEARA